MRAMVLGALVMAGAIAMAACSGSPVSCPASVAPAVFVTVRDSVTNALVGRGSRIIARDGAFADTARTSTYDGTYGLADERSGTYAVTVEQQGYRSWSLQGVSVTRGECHVRTASLTARLQR